MRSAMACVAQNEPAASAAMVVVSKWLQRAALADERAALVDDQRGGGFAPAQQIVQGRVEHLNVFCNERREAGHITLFWARFG